MNAARTNCLLVRTPEGITFSILLAGPVTRFLAYEVDLACIGTLTAVTGTVLGLLKLISADISFTIGTLLYFGISIGYGIACEWLWRGQTVGKRLLKLRVLDAQGLKLHPSQIVIRNLLRFVDALPFFYLVGGVACLLSRRAQRLGDLAANTIVVREARPADPDLDQLLAGKYNSFRAQPHLAARLRQRVTPALAGVALQALLRRDTLEPAARVELFAELARQFQTLVPFPAEVTDGLPDEQYVRNVVDIIFRDAA